MKRGKPTGKILKDEFEENYRKDLRHGTQVTPSGEPQRPEAETIPVVEEQVQIGKKVVETGKVHISKTVHEELTDVDIPFVHEEVEVERVELNQYVDTPPPAVRYEGDTMIISVLKEEVVLQKRLVLVEELHVTKKKVETHQTRQMPLKKEEITIERIPHGQPTPPRQP